MKERQKDSRKSSHKPSPPGGFWARTEARPGVISVRHSASRVSLTLAFLRRLLGWERRKD